MGIDGIEPDGIRNCLVTTAAGVVLWALALLIGWLGPPFAAVQHERTLFATMGLGMLTTVAGVTVMLAAVLA